MSAILDRFIYKRHHLVMNESEVLSVLKRMQKIRKSLLSRIFFNDVAIGNCGWSDTSKWFIHFSCSNGEWRILRKDLAIIRVFENLDIPQISGKNIYTTD